jgi:hypothetical protein
LSLAGRRPVVPHRNTLISLATPRRRRLARRMHILTCLKYE